MTDDFLSHMKEDEEVFARFEMFNFMMLYDKLMSEYEEPESKVKKFISKVQKKLNDYVVFDEKKRSGALEDFIREGILLSMLGIIEDADKAYIDNTNAQALLGISLSSGRIRRTLAENHAVHPFEIKTEDDRKYYEQHLYAITSNDYKKGQIYKNLLEQELKVLCIEWIARRCCGEFKNIPDNIYLYLPKSSSDFRDIVINLIWRIQTDISTIVRLDRGLDTEFKEELMDKDKKIQALERKLKESEESWRYERGILENKVLIIKEKLNKIEKKTDFCNDEVYLALERENKRLNRLLEREIEQNEQLRTRIGDTEAATVEHKDEPKGVAKEEINHETPYIFVMDGENMAHTVLLNSIKDRFPNCRVLSAKNFRNIILSERSPVVCMTNYISHSSYDSVKTKCRTAGIEMIHCAESSIESIEKSLSNNGYKL